MTKTVILGDVAYITKLAGYEFTKYIEYDNNGEIIALRALNLSNGQLDLTNIKRISRNVSDKLPRSKLYRGDILLSYTGTVGNFAFVDKDETYHLAPNVCLIRANENCLPQFLYYLIGSPVFRRLLLESAHGSTQATVPMKNIRNIKLNIPDIDAQKKIADILGSIDEKIELNRKMNQTLEQMGQALFRHYFIDNPEVEKWEECKLGDLTDINKESIGKDYQHDTIKYVDIASVSKGSVDKYETIEISTAPSRAKRIVRDCDIVWATVRPNRRAYSLIMSPPDNMIVSTGFAVLSPKKNALGFVYYHTSSQSFTDYLTLHARGAAYPAVTASDFKKAPIAMPDTETLDNFNKLTLPNMRMMGRLKDEIQTLTTLRDSLLPRLISGKIKV